MWMEEASNQEAQSKAPDARIRDESDMLPKPSEAAVEPVVLHIRFGSRVCFHCPVGT